MKSSYKKHLYTTTLSLSAAVLLSVISHGQASADSLERPQTEPSTVLEATPTSEQPVTAETTSPGPATTTEVTPASSAETAATSDGTSTTEVAPTASPSTNRATTTADQATRLADSTIYLSEKSTIDDKVQEKAQAAGKNQLDLRQ